ncbi:hypothetical protein GCM10027075_66550 [Streptomyces heilongjiangensis]
MLSPTSPKRRQSPETALSVLFPGAPTRRPAPLVLCSTVAGVLAVLVATGAALWWGLNPGHRTP